MHIQYRKTIKYKKGEGKKPSETSPLKIITVNILLDILLGYMCICVHFLTFVLKQKWSIIVHNVC